MSWIYLDNNATTKIDELVLEAMLPYLRESYGNPSSVQHWFGREASGAVETARERIASTLHVKTNELFFTSGATETINMVLQGIAQRYRRKGQHMITCQTEHKAVLNTCGILEKQGIEITYLGVDQNGAIDLSELAQSIREDTIMVCLMAANNETGVLHPIKEIAALCQQKDVLYFCDATQIIGKSDINLDELPIDILTLSAHKIHGPKGIGVLYIRRKSKPIQIPPLINGGSQEQGRRGGTLNVPAIVGLGKAFELFDARPQIKCYRDLLEDKISEHIPQIIIHAKNAPRLDNTSCIAFPYLKSSEIMTSLPELALSSGSACATGLLEPSHVLKAMGVPDNDAYGSIRFSLSKYTEKQEIHKTVELVTEAVEKIRQQSPIWALYTKGLLD
ncbi:MAG: cysteine desulfurase family protein [Sphingobacterium sp.]|uniref:cysteine desulfurase family protein n=1 Tax=Sphingobacterium sp. JB170 TaxID=1434842 RepID=UPI00097F40A8|nr:cysteine desulfurase family protein [Sphingobacterium sp. JB170]SJN48397.1 Cysteine desulfurase [Sphingobacterium sp. JB170]